MKIAIAARDLQSLSGVTLLTCELARALAERGHDVHLLSRKLPPVNGVVTLDKIGMLPFPSIGRAWSFDRFARRKAEGLAVDILHGQGDLTAQDVLTVNNVDIAEAKYTGRTKVGSAGTEYVRKRQWVNARRIIAVSKRAQQDIEEFYGVPRSRIGVIYWGVNTKRFNVSRKSESRKDLRTRLNLKDASRLFLSLISGDPERRNLKGLISAFAKARLPDSVLLIVGNTEASHYSEAKQLIAEGRLKMIEKSPEPENIYRACDIFVLPAHYETLGMTALEAMASGLPVVLTARCGAAELIEDGKTGLIVQDSRDLSALAAAFERIARDSGLAEALGRASLARAKELDFTNTVKSYEELYQDILGERK